ncbi:MAG TPA: hypothetical protein VHV49_14915, partial [Pseudonocardiaceae bacterium]|nr:hypothetical protein [Pseudonocardiaceae bacterium]
RRYGIVDEPGVNAVLAAVTGYWFRGSGQPEPPTAPGLRSHQRRCGESALRWLTAREPAVAG